MRIKIDGNDIRVDLNDKNNNIVDIAEKNGISIVAPCYKSNHKHGCCKACLILVDGNKKYACGTKPYDGMEITYKNEDLHAERKVNLKIYADKIKNGEQDNGCCSTSKEPNDESCCDGETSCVCG